MMRAVGTGGLAGERGPRSVLGKEDLHRMKEFNGSGWEHWSFLFKCAMKHASTENYRIVTATETGTQEVNLENIRALTELSAEDIEWMSCSLHHVIVQVVKGDSFTVVSGVGSANGIEVWRRIYHK